MKDDKMMPLDVGRIINSKDLSNVEVTDKQLGFLKKVNNIIPNKTVKGVIKGAKPVTDPVDHITFPGRKYLTVNEHQLSSVKNNINKFTSVTDPVYRNNDRTMINAWHKTIHSNLKPLLKHTLTKRHALESESNQNVMTGKDIFDYAYKRTHMDTVKERYNIDNRKVLQHLSKDEGHWMDIMQKAYDYHDLQSFKSDLVQHGRLTSPYDMKNNIDHGQDRWQIMSNSQVFHYATKKIDDNLSKVHDIYRHVAVNDVSKYEMQNASKRANQILSEQNKWQRVVGRANDHPELDSYRGDLEKGKITDPKIMKSVGTLARRNRRAMRTISNAMNSDSDSITKHAIPGFEGAAKALHMTPVDQYRYAMINDCNQSMGMPAKAQKTMMKFRNDLYSHMSAPDRLAARDDMKVKPSNKMSMKTVQNNANARVLFKQMREQNAYPKLTQLTPNKDLARQVGKIASHYSYALPNYKEQNPHMNLNKAGFGHTLYEDMSMDARKKPSKIVQASDIKDFANKRISEVSSHLEGRPGYGRNMRPELYSNDPKSLLHSAKQYQARSKNELSDAKRYGQTIGESSKSINGHTAKELTSKAKWIQIKKFASKHPKMKSFVGDVVNHQKLTVPSDLKRPYVPLSQRKSRDLHHVVHSNEQKLNPNKHGVKPFSINITKARDNIRFADNLKPGKRAKKIEHQHQNIKQRSVKARQKTARTIKTKDSFYRGSIGPER